MDLLALKRWRVMPTLISFVKMIRAVIFVALISGSLANRGSESLQLPALGRPFSLGDLYNVKTDQVVRGPTLWSFEHLSDYFEIVERKTDFEIIASDNVDHKKNHFDISASLALSFMGGLVKVSGSAGFLDDRVSTSNTARVSLKYDSRTFARKLKGELFMKVDYPEVLKKAPGATHVVTGIEYGVGAVFVFDQTVREYEEKKDVQGTMHIMVKSLPSIQIEGSGSVNLTEEQKKKTERFSCKFHGDLLLDQHPGNYVEAVRVYKRLPQLLGKNNENSVPMTIWLYPLDALPISKESELVHEIRNSLINEVTVQLNELEAFEIRSNDILQSEMALYHERISNDVALFKSYIHLFVLLFKQNLAKMLPLIRASGSENLLAQLLADKEASTFSQNNLNLWMKDAEQEVVVLSSTQTLPHYCKDGADFTAKLLSGTKYTISLVMTLDKEGDDFLAEMKKYLDEAKAIQRNAFYMPYIGRKNKWWQSNKLVSDLQHKSLSFVHFSQMEEKRVAEGYKSEIQFLTVEKVIAKEAKNVTPSISLQLYEFATLMDADYQIPSEPGTPRNVSSAHDSMMLTWDKPRHGEKNVEFYEVETFLLSKNGSKLEKVQTTKVVKGSDAMSPDVGSESTTISNLKPERIYSFLVYAVSALGRTSVSEESTLLATNTCPKGMFFSDEVCKPCAPMYFSDIEGARSCLKCAPGSISQGYGNAVCTLCPKGTFADNRCVPCEPGYFSDTTGVSSCQKCPLGTYGPGYGGSSCKDCPKGSTTVVSGSRYIDDCGADLNGKIKSTLNEFTRDITIWQKQTDGKLKQSDGKFEEFTKWQSQTEDKLKQSDNKFNLLGLTDVYDNIINMKSKNLKIRLVGGTFRYGRVEVFYNGKWGTVCDDYWNDSDYHDVVHGQHNADVVCRMLGFHGGGMAKPNAFYGQGSGPVCLDDVKCSGNEASIFDCPHGGSGCSHSEDVGVYCNV